MYNYMALLQYNYLKVTIFCGYMYIPTFDISADLHKSAKFNIKYCKQTVMNIIN